MDFCWPLERADPILVSTRAEAKWRGTDISLSYIQNRTVRWMPGLVYFVCTGVNLTRHMDRTGEINVLPESLHWLSSLFTTFLYQFLLFTVSATLSFAFSRIHYLSSCISSHSDPQTAFLRNIGYCLLLEQCSWMKGNMAHRFLSALFSYKPHLMCVCVCVYSYNYTAWTVNYTYCVNALMYRKTKDLATSGFQGDLCHLI